jgi:putative FmdB family regulatory protein
MPIYEFSCTQCRHEFELLIRSKKASAECPKCGSGKIVRKLSVFAARQGARGSRSKPSCPNYSPSCGHCCAGGHHSH